MSLFIASFSFVITSLNVFLGPAASVLSGNLLEMHVLKPQSKLTESELLRVGSSYLCFKQNFQIILMYVNT